MDKIITQVLGLCTSCKSVTPPHDRHKLISQPTPSEKYISNDRPKHEISRRRGYEKYLDQKYYFYAKNDFLARMTYQIT